MLKTSYEGSVKKILGPADFEGAQNALVFEFSDNFSVFDWGKMPDELEGKGEALAIMGSYFFEKMNDPKSWLEFSKTKEALGLRKGIQDVHPSLGVSFNELGESLQQNGLKNHYKGVLNSDSVAAGAKVNDLSQTNTLFKHFVVDPVAVVKPEEKNVLSKTVIDYLPTRNASNPKLVPLEVVFRFSLPAGSSFIKRIKNNPDYLSSLALGSSQYAAFDPKAKWEFPILELFTKLEKEDRVVSFTEALAISGISSQQLEKILMKTAWVAGWLKAEMDRCGLELADGKLEWGMDEKGESFLVDAIGPDEMRLMKDGVPLSKEFLRNFYRDSDWYKQGEQAKVQAVEKGMSDWKGLVKASVPRLPQEQKQLASQLYWALTNLITGKQWFEKSWSLDKVVEQINAVKQAGAKK